MKMIWAKKNFKRYDSDRESYYTEELLITEENGGKFRIVETKIRRTTKAIMTKPLF